MSESVNVLKTIGVSSYFKGASDLAFTPERLRNASLNKVDLLYLESLGKLGKISVNDVELLRLRTKQEKIRQLVCFLANLFNGKCISYSVMKTLRPFAYAGSDVDVLLKEPNDFTNAVKVLQNRGFLLSESQNRFTATLAQHDSDIYVDLQLEATVSSLPYMNKHVLFQNVKNVQIDGVTVKTLNAPAELIIVASHALYKEHMYTLADFYSSVLTLTHDNVKATCDLAEKTMSKLAVSTLFVWTQKIANLAFKTNIPAVTAALAVLDYSVPERMLSGSDLRLPFRLSKYFIFFSLMNKIYKDSYTRSGLVNALAESLSQEQLRRIICHFERQSY